MATHPKSANIARTPVRPTRRLWPWFAVGFLLVFIGMLLLVRMITIHPSGQHAVQLPLWMYYKQVVPEQFGSTALGAANGGGAALLETVLFHFLFSAAGGATGAGIGYLVGKLRSGTAASPNNAAPEHSGK